jgi:hypothetical protein
MTTQQSVADQADRDRAERDRKLADEALTAQRDRDAKTEEYLGADEYVLIGAMAQVKIRDDAGSFVVKHFNEGAVIKGEDVEEDNLRHLVDIRFLVPKDADEAKFAGPAGTPKPGEPPNVPVVEGMPVEMLPHEERLARQRAAADKAEQAEQADGQRKTGRQSKSDQGNG